MTKEYLLRDDVLKALKTLWSEVEAHSPESYVLCEVEDVIESLKIYSMED